MMYESSLEPHTTLTLQENNSSKATTEAAAATTTTTVGVLCTLASALTFAFVNVRNEMILGGGSSSSTSNGDSNAAEVGADEDDAKAKSKAKKAKAKAAARKQPRAPSPPPSNATYLTWLGIYGAIFSGASLLLVWTGVGAEQDWSRIGAH